jgi:hypothetical protein
VSQNFAHEAKAGEVVCLALGPLILLWVGGVIAGQVEVAEGGTRSRHYLLKLLLILVPEAVLLLALALIVGVISVVIVILVRGVELLPLGAVGDKVGGVAALIPIEEPKKATRGGWMRDNQNSSWELDLSLKIDPTFLSSNSAKTV